MADKLTKRGQQWAVESETERGGAYRAIDEDEALRTMMDLDMDPDVIEHESFPVPGLEGMGFEEFQRKALENLAKRKPKAKANKPVETEDMRRRQQLRGKPGPVAGEFEALTAMLKGKV